MHNKIALCLLALATSSAFAASPPSAKEILESVRLRQSQQQQQFEGKLREDATVVPFRFTQTGPVIRYSFTKPDEALQLRLGDNESRLEEVTGEGVEKISPAQFDRKIRGTAVTYEDLALRFLYWPNAQVIGDDTIQLVDCWRLELRAPPRQSQYSTVRIWVQKDGPAVMKVEGYDSAGKMVKRFTVVSGQKIEGRWFLKQMRIETFDPGTAKVKTRTYLEINK
jgi:Outer membrane lipoprotein-sorting protein